MNKALIIFFSISFSLISCKGGNNNEPVLNGGGVTNFTKVQPMTGIVAWDNNPNANSGAIHHQFVAQSGAVISALV
jgi:hypothetical protein